MKVLTAKNAKKTTRKLTPDAGTIAVFASTACMWIWTPLVTA